MAHQVPVYLEEETEARELTNKEKESGARWGKAYAHRHARVTNGKLKIWLGRSCASGQSAWRDGKKARLEDLLPSFMAGLAEAGAAQKVADEARAREEAERQERRAQEEKAAEEKREEQARVDELVAKARAWHYRRFIGAYLDWMEEQQKAAAGGQIDPNGDFAKWLTWARKQSGRLDPWKDEPTSYSTGEGSYARSARESTSSWWAAWQVGRRSR